MGYCQGVSVKILMSWFGDAIWCSVAPWRERWERRRSNYSTPLRPPPPSLPPSHPPSSTTTLSPQRPSLEVTLFSAGGKVHFFFLPSWTQILFFLLLFPSFFVLLWCLFFSSHSFRPALPLLPSSPPTPNLFMFEHFHSPFELVSSISARQEVARQFFKREAWNRPSKYLAKGSPRSR